MRYSAHIVLLAVFFGFFLSFSCGDTPPNEKPASEQSADTIGGGDGVSAVDAGEPDKRISQPDKAQEKTTPPDTKLVDRVVQDTASPEPQAEPAQPDTPTSDAPKPDVSTPDVPTPDVPAPDAPTPDRSAPEKPSPEPPPTEPDAGSMSEPTPEPEPVIPEPRPEPTPEPTLEPTPERTSPDVPPTSTLNDEFNGTSLHTSWKLLNANLIKYSVAGGWLHMTPTAYCVWYHRDQGPYIYKTIQGNFTMTTRVRARKASNTSQPVGAQNAPYQFAGLMLRNPTIQGTNENYIFVVVGMHGPNRGLVIEQKTTVNGSSSVSTTVWPSGDAELRLCRVNSTYLLFARAVGATSWTQMRRYTRTDLPTNLQVGMIGYTYTGRYDMRASFDYIRFKTGITQEADCTK